MISIVRPPVTALRRHLRTRTRGQSLVELALILPVIMVFFAAILDLGRIAAAEISLTNAAREGAFQAAKTPTDFDSSQSCPADGNSNKIFCRVKLESGGTVTINPSDVAVSCSPVTCDKGIGNTVTVRVTGHFTLLTPLMSAFFGGSSNVSFGRSSTANIATLPTGSSGSTATPPPAPTPTPVPTPTATPVAACVDKPSAGFTYSQQPANRKAPSQVTFTDTSSSVVGCSIDQWFWESSDGWTSSQRNPPPHTYVVPGTYFVTLQVHNAAGFMTSGVVQILVKP